MFLFAGSKEVFGKMITKFSWRDASVYTRCLYCQKRNFVLKVEKVKYSKTVQLPQTKFPVWVSSPRRADLDDKIIKICGFNELYNWQRNNLGEKEYVLHDGPPYANGVPHMGHAINKILKDIIIRNKVIQGVKVHYKPGWDCHGLPIEMKVLMGDFDENKSPVEVRKKSRKFAAKAISEQKEIFKSWGLMADWENQCYYTYNPSYIKNQMTQFYKLYEKGLIYRDLKPVYWSPSSKTALAEAELEYNDNHKSKAIVVKFRLNNIPNTLQGFGDDIHVLIWTTTPWTLPANQAVAFNPTFNYLLVDIEGSTEKYIISKGLQKAVECNLNKNFTVIHEFSGDELSSASYFHPFTKENLSLLPGKHVTNDMGTGLVHTAPSHGPDDFLLALQHGISVNCIVDENGCYTTQAGNELQFLPVLKEGTDKVLRLLRRVILHQETITHSYPYDWRTNLPVILRASKQWFFDTNAIKEKAIELAKQVPVFPSRNISGLISQLERRPYWCISRQRAWGVPIPVVYDAKSDEPILNEDLLHTYTSLLDSKGPDFWWSLPLSEILKNTKVDPSKTRQGKDILDIWFDSGLSWSSVLEGKKADLYLEGIDQFTGWFQSSLLTSVALTDNAPYKALFVHGFAVDEEGRKMSKSIGNVVDPQTIACGGNGPKKEQAYGIDTLRWWVAAHAVQHTNVPVSQAVLKDSFECTYKIRNIIKFLLGSINDLPEELSPELRYLDQYMLNKLSEFQNEAMERYNEFQFNRLCTSIMNFIANDVSGLYCHLVKDRLYCDEPNSDRRRAAQFTLLNILEVLSSVLSPILPVLVEEAHQYHPHNTNHQPFFQKRHDKLDTKQLNIKDEVFQIVELALSVKKNVTQDIPVNCSNWQLSCTIRAEPEVYSQLKRLQVEETSVDSELSEILQVSSVTLLEDKAVENFDVRLKRVQGFLCDRCRKFSSNKEGQPCERCSKVLLVLGF